LTFSFFYGIMSQQFLRKRSGVIQLPGITILDARPYGVGKGLVKALGSEGKAEAWLEDYQKLSKLYGHDWAGWLAEIDERVLCDSSSLGKRTYCLGRRLVFMFGSEAAANEWLETENSQPEFRGHTPADAFAEKGEGWYLTQTCNVYVREHLDAYLAAQEQASA